MFSYRNVLVDFHQHREISFCGQLLHLIKGKKNQKLLNLNDQHVLSEVVPLFEDYSNWCRRGGRRHGTELQPQGLLLRGHHLAFVQLYEGEKKRADSFVPLQLGLSQILHNSPYECFSLWSGVGVASYVQELF